VLHQQWVECSLVDLEDLDPSFLKALDTELSQANLLCLDLY